MSNYVKAVNFAAKDALITGDPNKKAKGTEVDTEFNAIATMSGTKEDSTNKGAISGYAALDVNQIVQGAGLNATGTVIPANGVYLPAANTLGFATATTQRVTINATGNVIVVAPTSGVAVSIAGASNTNSLTVNSGVTASQAFGFINRGGTNSSDYSALFQNYSASINFLKLTGDGSGFIGYNGAAQTISWTAAGNVIVSAPSSGTAVTISTVAGAVSALTLNASAVGDILQVLNGVTLGQSTIQFNTTGVGSVGFIGTVGAANQLVTGSVAGDLILRAQAGGIRFTTNGGTSSALTIAAAGNVTIAAPTSGASLTITGVAQATYAPAMLLTAPNTASQSNGLQIKAGTNTNDAVLILSNAANTFNYFALLGDGSFSFVRSAGTQTLVCTAAGNVTVSAPSSGTSLAVTTVGGTGVGLTIDANPVYAGIPQNLQSGTTYTFVLADANKHIYATNAGAKTFTVPANASVAFPIGTAVTIVNGGSGVLSLPITTDAMALANTALTGTRTLAVSAVATLLKINATTWIISGPGVS